MDFVSDRLMDGRWFRILTVVDQYTRECLCAHADRSQTGEKVAEPLERVIAIRGAPETITSDNGSEFAGRAMDYWGHHAGISSAHTVHRPIERHRNMLLRQCNYPRMQFVLRD